MSETENAFLKSEIARLNKTIEALLSYNELLRQQIALNEKGNGSEELFGGIPEKGNGSEELFGGIPEKGNGSEELFGSIPEKGNGSEEVFGSIPEKGNGSEEVFGGIPEKGNGSEEVFGSIPEKVEITPGSVATLHVKLRDTVTGKVKRSATQNSAKILLHICNGGKGGYAELIKLTGLSEGGVGKRIMAMKKNGLIISDGHRNYKLTAKGLGIVKGLEG